MKIHLLLLVIVLTPLFSFGQPGNDSTNLKVLSWNIHMLPSLAYNKSKKLKRSSEIVDVLINSNYDIILFQEAFHHRARHIIKKGLKSKYAYAYGPANKKFLSIKGNSGLWILSNRPLILKQELVFDECEGVSCLARKGAMLVEGEHYGHLFQLVNTHSNGGPINNYQFHLIREKLLDPFKKERVPQIICGDFNTRRTSPKDQYNAMLRIFDIHNLYPQFDDRSEEHKNHRVINDVYSAWPDFIFVKENDDQAINVKRIATVSLGPIWNPGSVKVYNDTVGLSDHYPIMIDLNWSPLSGVRTAVID